MSPRVLTGEALAEWLVTKLITPDGRVVVTAEALDEAREMLARTLDIGQLRSSAEALAAGAAYLANEKKDPAAGDKVLGLIIELKSRFEAAIAKRGVDKTERTVQAARDGKDRLGAHRVPAAVVSDRPVIAATKFRPVVAG